MSRRAPSQVHGPIDRGTAACAQGGPDGQELVEVPRMGLTKGKEEEGEDGSVKEGGESADEEDEREDDENGAEAEGRSVLKMPGGYAALRA